MPAIDSSCILRPPNQANYYDTLWVSPQKATDKKGPGKTRASPTGRIAYHYPDMQGFRIYPQI